MSLSRIESALIGVAVFGLSGLGGIIIGESFYEARLRNIRHANPGIARLHEVRQELSKTVKEVDSHNAIHTKYRDPQVVRNLLERRLRKLSNERESLASFPYAEDIAKEYGDLEQYPTNTRLDSPECFIFFISAFIGVGGGAIVYTYRRDKAAEKLGDI